MAWACSICTLENEETSSVCKVCGGQRGTSSQDGGSKIDGWEHIEMNGAGCMGDSGHVRCESYSEAEYLENEVRIVILGRTGAGKSSTGNNILDNDIFKSSASGSSITKKCQLGWTTRFNRNIQVVDTPGLFDTGMTNEEITKEVIKCIGITSPGPHVFVMVVRVDRFTPEEKATVEHFQKVFGDKMLRHLVVLFTRKDDLKHDHVTLDEYVQQVPPDLKKFLQDCNHRYVAFDNRATPVEREQDVREFMQLVESMVRQNDGSFYTNEMFEEAEKAIRRREAEMKQRHEEQIRMERERILSEFEKNIRSKEADQQDTIGQLNARIKELEEGQKGVDKLTDEVKELHRVIEKMEKEKIKERKRMEAEAAERAEARAREMQGEQLNYRLQVRQDVSFEEPDVFDMLLGGLKKVVEKVGGIGPMLVNVIGNMASKIGKAFR